jgi:hypothetical protein
MKAYIGIDNGTSGSIAVVNGEDSGVARTPAFYQQSYTKKKQNISRVDVGEFREIMKAFSEDYGNNVLVMMERPVVNPGRFKTTQSAMRCLEAQLIVIEDLGLPIIYVDSKDWQKVLLPNGVKGATELKKASLDIGLRLFPQHEKFIRKQKDADALLIAEWARRSNL